MATKSISARPLNQGTIVSTVTGINGVAAGGTMQIQITPQKRIHRIQLYTTGVYYTSPTVSLVGAGGTAATFTITTLNGVITAVAIATAGSGMTPGTYTTAGGGNAIVEPTVSDTYHQALGYSKNPYGANISITVASGGTVTATPVVVSGGTAAAVPPDLFFNSAAGSPFIISVGGAPVRDVPVSYILGRNRDSGDNVAPLPGMLDLYFTEPTRRITSRPTITVWDLWGQNQMQLQGTIVQAITNPGVVGIYEYDADSALRNTVTNKSGEVTPILDPVGHRLFNQGTLPAGQSSITKIPIANSYDQTGCLGYTRLWFLSGIANNILSIWASIDSVQYGPFTIAQLQENAATYGFTFNYFSAALIFDKDRQMKNRLRVANSLDLYITLGQADTVTIFREITPKAFISA